MFDLFIYSFGILSKFEDDFDNRRLITRRKEYIGGGAQSEWMETFEWQESEKSEGWHRYQYHPEISEIHAVLLSLRDVDDPRRKKKKKNISIDARLRPI